MTRVLFVIPGLGTGGAEKSLAAELPGLIARGIVPSVACLHPRPEGVQEEVSAMGIPVSVLNASVPGRLVELRSTIQRFAPDLVHSSVFEADVAARVAAGSLGIPVVGTLVNTSYNKSRVDDPNVRPLSLEVHRLVDAATARIVAGHRAISAPVKEAAVKRLGIDPDSIDVIPRGRDLARLQFSADDRARARAELGVPEDALVVGNVARHEHQKGLDTLLTAVRILWERNLDVLLVQAGRRGHASSTLDELATQDGFRPARVRWLGHRSDVTRTVLPALDVFAFPSRYEGFGGAAMEAMAAGLPVVASDIPVLRSVLGQAATYAPPDDPVALASVIESALRAGRRPLAESIRDEAWRYDLGRVSEEVFRWLTRMAHRT